MINVRPVQTQSDWKAFKEIPHTVYSNDSNWLREESIDLDSVLINPSETVKQYRETQAYVAYDGQIPVGRIVAIADQKYNEYQQDHAAFFGFYESIRSDNVAFQLLDTAANWARRKSLKRILGPMNPSLIYSAGMLVEGCDRPALIGMPYNPAYYADQVCDWGMHKLKDMHSYFCSDPYTRLCNLNGRLWNRWQRRSSVAFRSLNFNRFKEEVEQIRQIYNAAFVGFWGFTPLEQDEFLQLAYSFKPILDKDLVVFALLDNQPVAFLMAIPDVNQALIKSADWNNEFARTFSTLWHLKGPCRHRAISHARIDMLAVHPDCPDIGTGALLIFEVLRRVRDKGYTAIEAAPLLEDGDWWRSVFRTFFSSPYRIHRVFVRDLR
jgi:GNAT superfamily N-acetyltransferase